VESANTTFAAYKPLFSIDGCNSTLKANQYTGQSSWDDAYQAVYWPAAEPGSIVGINIQDFSRIVSQDLVDSKAGLESIKNYLIGLPPTIPFIWQNYVGGVTKDVPTDATAVHPAWRNAFAFIDVVNFGAWSGPTATQNSTSDALVANMTEIFGTAAYYNEAWDEKKWQDSFFGSNYARLLKIKEAVDPKNVFNCRMCVGSEGGF
jgi:FAD/FMN-containing dehydrogenase